MDGRLPGDSSSGSVRRGDGEIAGLSRIVSSCVGFRDPRILPSFFCTPPCITARDGVCEYGLEYFLGVSIGPCSDWWAAIGNGQRSV
jgi:hypothetical protein